MRRGTKHTEEARRKISLSRMGNKWRLGKTFSDESKRKMSLSHKGQIAWNKGKKWSDEVKEKFSSRRKELWKNEDYRKRMVTAHKGKKLPEEQKIKIAQALKGRKPPQKAVDAAILARRGKPISPRHRENLIKAFATKECKEKRSIASKKLWSDPEYRRKVITAQLKGLMKRPTSFEMKIIELIKKYNLPFEYVGNGKVLICYKNPDFIHTNGKKLLIETYFSRWHGEDYETKRAEIFGKYGFKTLFLNENDLESKNWEAVCLNKINEFNES